MKSTGLKTIEAKAAGGFSLVAILPVLLDTIRGGEEAGLSPQLQMTLVICATAVICAFVISRGLAKNETRGQDGTPGAGG